MLRFSWIAMFALMALAGCSRSSDGAKENETAAHSTLKAVDEPKEGPSLQALQIAFIENRGQIDPKVGYYARISGGQLYLTHSGELVLSLSSADGADSQRVVIRESLLGAQEIDAVGRKAAATRVNYFVGSDRKKWQTDIPTYQTVSLGEVYQGIELELRASARTVEKLFRIRPGADPGAISTQVRGAASLEVTGDGRLALDTSSGKLHFSAPVAYQVIDGRRRPVDVAYRVADDSYGFELGDYDRNQPLVIDPVLASYIGGTGLDRGKAIALHATDGVYVAGVTQSMGFADLTRDNTSVEVFIARLDADLSQFLSATFLGGDGADEPTSIVTHPTSGNVYVVGHTDSTDFPNGSAGVASGRGGNVDAFIAVLSSTLVLNDARYIGGSNIDRAYALALRPGGTADMLYVAGGTQSNDFPISPLAFDPNHGESTDDAFVTRLELDLSILTSTYLGNRAEDDAYALAVSPQDPYDVYVAGTTSFEPGEPLDIGDFPGIDPNAFNGENDVFVARMNDTLTDLLAAAYVGGPRIEFGQALAVVPSGSTVYVAGGTICSEDPDAGSGDWLGPGDGAQVDCGGDQDAFVARLNATDLTRLGASYLGGLLFERALGLDLHPGDGSVYLYGNTRSSNLPGTDGAVQPSGGGYELFLARFSAELDVLQQSTYLGGTGLEEIMGPGLALSDDGSYAFVTGSTESDDFPGVDDQSAQTFPGGSVDAFVARVDAHLRAVTPGPNIEVTPLEHDFGRVAVGVATPLQTFTIENVGSELLTVRNIAFVPDSAEFVLTVDAGGSLCDDEVFTLGAGEGCWVGVHYEPSQVGADQIALEIESDSVDQDDFVHVILSGEGHSDGRPRIRGRWEIHDVDSGEGSVDLAVDDSGRVHLCYFTELSVAHGGPALRYATGRPQLDEPWLTEDIALLTPLGGDDCAIAVDANQRVHVAYTAQTVATAAQTLRYARRSDDLWEPGEVVEAGHVDGEIDIEVFNNSPDDVRIVYRTRRTRSGESDVYYQAKIATLSSTGWTNVVIDEGESEDFAQWNRFAKPSERFSFSFPSAPNESSYLGISELTAWPPSAGDVSTALVELDRDLYAQHFVAGESGSSGVRVIQYVGIDASDGAVHATGGLLSSVPLSEQAPSRFLGYDLEYLARGPVVLGDIDLSADFRLPEDADAYLFQLGFRDADDADLRYVGRPGGPDNVILVGIPRSDDKSQDRTMTDVVDSGGDVGRSVELAVDGDNAPHLAYIEATGSIVRYARQIVVDAALPSLSPRRWRFEPEVGDSDFHGFTVTNVGSNEELTILDASIGSQDAWALIPDCDGPAHDGIPFIGATLAPGEFRTACVSFSPTTTNIQYQSLAVLTSAGALTVDLVGKGREAEEPPPPDGDADGVPDEEEDLGRSEPYDGNDDGIPDRDQKNVTTLYTFDDEDRVTIEVPQVGSPPVLARLEDVQALDPASVVPSSGGSPGVYAYGWFSFRIVNEREGPAVPFKGTVEVRMHHIDQPVYDYTKHGPSHFWNGNDPYSFWRETVALEYPESEERAKGVGAIYNHAENRVELFFESGLLGDHDLTNDGVIADPGGPAVLVEGTGEGGGCSCRVQEPRNTAGTGLLVSMVALFLLRRRRRKI